nr:MAG TPA: hypothetical protein [Caudoviricetes sp.]
MDNPQPSLLREEGSQTIMETLLSEGIVGLLLKDKRG